MGFDAFFLGGVVVEWSAHEDTVNIVVIRVFCSFCACVLLFVAFRGRCSNVWGGGI